MRNIVIIFLFFFIYNKIETKENTKFNPKKTICLLNNQIALDKNKESTVDSINIEIKNELLLYKAKEDYFAVALEDQSNRFALIIGALISLLGIVSFAGVKIERNEIDKKFKSISDEFEKLKADYIEINSELFSNVANSNVLISKTFRDLKYYVKSFEYCLASARANLNSMENDLDKNFSVIKANLELALEDLTEIKKDTSLKEELNDIMIEIGENLDVMYSNCNNSDIKDMLAEIRISVKNYLK